MYIHIYIYICTQKEQTMYPFGYYQSANGRGGKTSVMVTHALWNMMYGYIWLIPMNQRVLNKSTKEHKISFIIYIFILNAVTDKGERFFFK